MHSCPDDFCALCPGQPVTGSCFCGRGPITRQASQKRGLDIEITDDMSIEPEPKRRLASHSVEEHADIAEDEMEVFMEVYRVIENRELRAAHLRNILRWRDERTGHV